MISLAGSFRAAPPLMILLESLSGPTLDTMAGVLTSTMRRSFGPGAASSQTPPVTTINETIQAAWRWTAIMFFSMSEGGTTSMRIRCPCRPDEVFKWGSIQSQNSVKAPTSFGLDMTLSSFVRRPRLMSSEVTDRALRKPWWNLGSVDGDARQLASARQLPRHRGAVTQELATPAENRGS